jgi:hypothetical protein
MKYLFVNNKALFYENWVLYPIRNMDIFRLPNFENFKIKIYENNH